MEKCYYHPRSAAATKCVGCKMAVCATCRDEGHKGLCDACVKKKATLTDTRDSREAARERSAAASLGSRPGTGTRSDVIYCFRHQDIRASASCATCSRAYCPACLNTSGVCGVCARTNKDAQAMAFGPNERGRAILAEQAAEEAKKRLGPREYMVVVGMVLALGVSWKLMQPKIQKVDQTGETLQRVKANDLSAAEAAMLASIRKEKKVVLRDPPPKPRAATGGAVSYRGATGGAAAGGGNSGGAASGGGFSAEALEIRAVEPADGTIVGGSAVIRAAIAGSPSRVVCEVDGVAIGRSSGAAPRFGWNTRAAGNGPHSVTITASSAQGSTSTSFTLNVMNR